MTAVGRRDAGGGVRVGLLLAALLATGCHAIFPYTAGNGQRSEAGLDRATDVRADGPDLGVADGPDLRAADVRPGDGPASDGPGVTPVKHSWSKGFGGQGVDYGARVVVDASGNITVVGQFEGTLDCGGGEHASKGNYDSGDIFIASYGPTGVFRWSKHIGPDARVGGVAVDANGSVFVAGSFQWLSDLGDGVIVPSPATGWVAAFVSKFDHNGNFKEKKTFGATGAQTWGAGVAVDASGNVTVVGQYYGTVDFGGGPLASANASTKKTDLFVASYHPTQGYRWAKRFGGTGGMAAEAVAVDGNGNVTVAGELYGTADLGGGPLASAGDADIFLASYNATGTHRWSKCLGGPSHDAARGVAVDASGNASVTGSFQGSVDFGGGVRTSAGNQDIFVASYTSTGAHRWSKGFGAADGDWGMGVTVDPIGNVLVTGAFQKGVDFGGGVLNSAGGTDVFVAMYGPAGQHQMSRPLGSWSADEGHGVAVDGNGNVTLAGGFSQGVDFGGGALRSPGGLAVFVASYGKNNAHRWSKSFGGGEDAGLDVAVDGSGNAVAVGKFKGAVDCSGAFNNSNQIISAGLADVFVARYGPAGALLWQKRFGGPGEDAARGAAVDGSGNVFVTGDFEKTGDFGGGALTSAGFADLFVASYGPTGAHRWSNRFGGPGNDIGEGAAVDGSGNVFVTGRFQATIDLGGGPLTSAGGYDAFVASYAPNGIHRWSRRFGSPGDDGGEAVAVDASGNVTVTGYFTGTADPGGGPLATAGGSDIFVASYGPTGAHRWSKRFGGAGDDAGLGVAVDGTGNVTVTGLFVDAVDFGGGSLASAGFSDIFVASYGPTGAHRWSKRFGGAGTDKGQGVAVDGSGNATVTGQFQGTADFGGGAFTSVGFSADIFVASFWPAGAHRWSKSFGSARQDSGQGVAMGAGGAVLLTGDIGDPVSFGGGAVQGWGNRDVFVVRLAP